MKAFDLAKRGLFMLPIITAFLSSAIKHWPENVVTIQITSSFDATMQPALLYSPDLAEPRPLLVALHTWSDDYTQEMSVPYAKWCIENDWIFIHPDFRGPNNKPVATGSEAVISDVLDAVKYAQTTSRVDSSRIYLVGCSGGGYTALLLAARAPQVWAGVSAWVPISSLKNWYRECVASGRRYADDLVKSCGGVPGASAAVDQEYARRSPLTYLNPSLTVPLDINAGIHDGHTGSVPIRHSLDAFNVVADTADQILETEIQFFVNNEAVPPHLQQPLDDPFYGEKIPLFRRTSRAARLTIFKGGHEIIFEAALNWLSRQKKEK